MGSPPTGFPVVVERRREQRVTGDCTRTDRRSLETRGPNAIGSRQTDRGEGTQRPKHAGKNTDASGLAQRVKRALCHDIENKSLGRRSTSEGGKRQRCLPPLSGAVKRRLSVTWPVTPLR